MSVAKVYNSGTGQWEPALVGKQGNPGIVKSDTAPSDTSVLWYDTADTAEPLVIPAGGESGQILQKSTNSDYDTQWSNTPSHNYIINGAFDINQRGFTSQTSGAYTYDRWLQGRSGGTVTATAETFTLADLSVIGYGEATNYFRQLVSGQSGTSDYAQLQQRIEDVRTLAGQEITISFYAKAASGTPNISVVIDQSFGSGGSSTVSTTIQKIAITTSWARYSVTGTLPSISGKTIGTGSHIRNVFWTSAGSAFDAVTDTLGVQNNTFDIWGVQLEAGSVATPFKRNAPSLQGELAACQRYYQIYGTEANEFLTTGFCYSTSQTLSAFNLIQEMRAAPTISFSSASDFNLYAVGASGQSVTFISAAFASAKSFRLQANIGTTALGAGNATNVFSSSGGGRIEVDAEL